MDEQNKKIKELKDEIESKNEEIEKLKMKIIADQNQKIGDL